MSAEILQILQAASLASGAPAADTAIHFMIEREGKLYVAQAVAEYELSSAGEVVQMFDGATGDDGGKVRVLRTDPTRMAAQTDPKPPSAPQLPWPRPRPLRQG